LGAGGVWSDVGIANATPGQRAEDTFTAFYRHRYPATVRLAWLLTGDSSQCEDVVQDAFTRVHARWADVADPAAYLRTVVVNGLRDRARRRGREDRRLRLARPLVEAVDAQDLVLLDAVAHLGYRQRAAVVLRYWADLTDAEIAATLDVAPATVRSLLARAMEQLRKEIER
jgi:RNA polymerase sigma-70 factor (sigma-E family)